MKSILQPAGSRQLEKAHEEERRPSAVNNNNNKKNNKNKKERKKKKRKKHVSQVSAPIFTVGLYLPVFVTIMSASKILWQGMFWWAQGPPCGWEAWEPVLMLART